MCKRHHVHASHYCMVQLDRWWLELEIFLQQAE
ncbi:unnamed protein product [Staurois parvus]|uniref:Uncharacterized protein n=1 Tax=Staurois parvus TaxID=386267 RepID=A0ABN9F660_9NEOB|nr:unnamed protein product [Staurois parvus]